MDSVVLELELRVEAPEGVREGEVRERVDLATPAPAAPLDGLPAELVALGLEATPPRDRRVERGGRDVGGATTALSSEGFDAVSNVAEVSEDIPS